MLRTEDDEKLGTKRGALKWSAAGADVVRVGGISLFLVKYRSS